jgi:hypothetical protein
VALAHTAGQAAALLQAKAPAAAATVLPLVPG